MENTKQTWILAGYDLFAKEGPRGLQVEVMARKVAKSKSSFYHHFVDIDLFTDVLLSHHLERAKNMAERTKLCKTMLPDVVNVFIDAKQDLFFNRQLRIHRDIPLFKKCFDKASKLVADSFAKIWAEAIGLPQNTQLAHTVFALVSENFYLQITEETLTYEWFEQYMQNITGMVKDINKV